MMKETSRVKRVTLPRLKILDGSFVQWGFMYGKPKKIASVHLIMGKDLTIFCETGEGEYIMASMSYSLSGKVKLAINHNRII